jgi:hypothetical protein
MLLQLIPLRLGIPLRDGKAHDASLPGTEADPTAISTPNME